MDTFLLSIACSLSNRLRTLTTKRAFFYLRKIAGKITLLLLFPISYVSLSAYSLIRGKKYRVAGINAKHLGGWSYSLDGFLRKVKNSTENQINYLFVMNSREIANSYFYELMKRYVNVVENPFTRLILLPLAKMQNRFQTKEYGYLTEEIDKHMEAFPWFNGQDRTKGELLLKNLGLDSRDAWYVCFFARDNAYNESTAVGDELTYLETYHGCRNSDIDNYITAIRFILENGGHVIRMGSVAKKRISYSHPRLIDYPFSMYRSDFADIYLATHCKFFIGAGSGIVDLSVISDVPLGMVDIESYDVRAVRQNMLYIPKLMKCRSTGKYVSVKKYFDIFDESTLSTAITRIKEMKKNDIIYEDNSGDDILMITKAFYERFITKSVTDKEWAAWQEGGDCCRPFYRNYCHIWGQFIDKHGI